MNFTREPIIETIITPRDGYKILVRSSKGSGQEEYTVDAVEVVSFGNSVFFRCVERPKCFLVPVADYEAIEVKETKVVLKNIAIERSIKIGGGREAGKPQRELVAEKPTEAEEAVSAETEGGPSEMPIEHRKRDRKRNRRRRASEERKEGKEFRQEQQPEKEAKPVSKPEGGISHDETPVSSPTFSTLFPPPTTLISETISRYSEAGFISKPLKKPEAAEEKPSIETFIEEKKEDILHQHMVETEIEPKPSYPLDLEDSEELFITKEAKEKKEEEPPKQDLFPYQRPHSEDDSI